MCMLARVRMPRLCAVLADDTRTIFGAKTLQNKLSGKILSAYEKILEQTEDGPF
jgi:hypothetical protein